MCMKIFNNGIIANTDFSQNKQLSAENKIQTKYADSSMVLRSLSFLGNYNTPIVKKSIDVPIKDDEEFKEVMGRVYNAKDLNGNVLWIGKDYRDFHTDYTYATDIEMGLIPYCGINDNSEIINMYLSGRLDNKCELTNKRSRIPKDINSCVDVIRALDYSLDKLDNRYGTYKGLVYRRGFMAEDCEQYFSTTKDLDVISETYRDFTAFDPSVGYSVIRVKDGHKIYRFQEKMGSNFAENEKEVLLPRKAKFKKLTLEEMDEELLTARENMAKNLFYGADKIISGKVKIPMFFTKEQLLNLVDVYEEI